jgi:ABC-type nitrate/sulfonate/bicarbonate transport system substrate-binding protein
MNRRVLLVAAATAAAVSARARAQSPAAADVEFVVNAPGAGNWLVYCAQYGNFFRDEGLRVGISNSGSPTTTINVVATNSANMGFDGTDVAVEAIAHQLPLKIVAPEFIPTPYALLTTPGIASWNDLKGKTVILGASGDISSITFDLMSATRGLTRADFSIARGQTSSSRYQALLSGNVAATVLSQPFSIQAQDAGMRTLAMASETIKDWVDTCIVVNTTWAAANRGLVVRVLRAMRKGAFDAYAHPDAAVAALVSATGIAPDVARKAYDLDFRRWRAFDPNLRMSLPGLRAMISFAVKEGAIAQEPSVSDVYDPSYAAQALR